MKDKFETEDFCLASYLLAKKVRLLGIERKNPASKRTTFSFSNTQDCESLISEFSQMKGNVEPLTFASAQKQLKYLIYL